MNEVVKILMERDGLTKEEANAQVMLVREEFEECGYDPYECEEIMMDELGLEMDYLFDII